MHRNVSAAITCLTMIVVTALLATPAIGGPCIFWASDPVRPGETVLIHGSDLGGSSAVVEMARLLDTAAAEPVEAAQIKDWTQVPLLQSGGQSLKFVVPGEWEMGVFACRVTAGGSTTERLLLNAPDTWWMQGDEGESGSPGGWLRILGKSLNLSGQSSVRLVPQQGPPVVLKSESADGYSLRLDLPADLKAGEYAVAVHNGRGGNAGWHSAGNLRIAAAPAPSTAIYSVLNFYGPDEAKKMRGSLVKYGQPIDRTEGIQAALKKAKDNGGGIIYFPAGRYTIKGPLVIPERTVLRGEGTGLVTLWWGTGHFNLDGGGPQGRARVEEPKPPQTLIQGSDYAIEDMSLYLPLDYEQGLSAEKRLRMRRVKIRVDHYWLVQGRGNGAVARLGRNFEVTDCDILSKGDALVPGEFGVIARNRIMSNKSNTPMGGSRQVIIEDNQFISMDPTAYQNIAGSSRNIYYAHNRHEALYGHQSDYSFTFDAGGGAYVGKIAEARGEQITLAADPTYPDWAKEKSNLWRRAALCILDGRGLGQWRDLVSNNGREIGIDRPFDVPPDGSSIVTIVPFNGRVLIVGNRFEDANWVNAGYGTSIDVICAGNQLFRCADMMNYGVRAENWVEPSWHVQYFDNVINEGQTSVSSSSGGQKPDRYSGPLTRWAIHRRQTIASDNSGGISVGGNIDDVIVEGCTLKNPASGIRVDGPAREVLLRNNVFGGDPAPRYTGDGVKAAVVLPGTQLP